MIKSSLIALASVLFVICAIVGTYYYRYPYGNRGSGLQGVSISLVNYASDHKGWYPNKMGSPFQSLKMLYPYDQSGDLAGLSEDVLEMRKRASLGLDLNERVSGLVYFPGLRDNDDANLMIIYERQEGICTTGRRSSGHAVGFIGGYVRQVPKKDWNHFLAEQEALRTKAMANRVAPTNTDLVPSEQVQQ